MKIDFQASPKDDFTSIKEIEEFLQKLLKIMDTLNRVGNNIDDKEGSFLLSDIENDLMKEYDHLLDLYIALCDE